MFKCDLCSEIFSRKSYLHRHTQQDHDQTPVKHYVCSSNVTHKDCSTNLPQVTLDGLTRIVTAHAFGNAIRHLRIFPNNSQKYLPFDFLITATPLIESTLEILKSEQKPMKISFKICVLFVKNISERKDGRTEILNSERKDEAYFSTKTEILNEFDLSNAINQLDIKIDKYNKRGSNWKIDSTLFLEIEIAVYNT